MIARRDNSRVADREKQVSALTRELAEAERQLAQFSQVQTMLQRERTIR
jgi:hypothetical protein